MAAVRDTAAVARVVTLTGPGGVGKTSLALWAAAELAPTLPDGAWWCELATITSGDAVAEVVVTTLGLQPRQGLSVTERIIEYLCDAHGLLVLDNAEHLIDAVARLSTGGAALRARRADVGSRARTCARRVARGAPLGAGTRPRTGAARVGGAGGPCRRGHARRTVRVGMACGPAGRGDGLPSPRLAQAHAVTAMGMRIGGDLPRARMLAERALQMSGPPGAQERYLPLYVLSEIAFFEGTLAEADGLASELKDLAVPDAYRKHAMQTEMVGVLTPAYEGRTAEALDSAERFLDRADREGDPTTMAWARYALAEVVGDTAPHRALVLLDDVEARAVELAAHFLSGVTLVAAASLRASWRCAGGASAVRRGRALGSGLATGRSSGRPCATSWSCSSASATRRSPPPPTTARR